MRLEYALSIGEPRSAMIQAIQSRSTGPSHLTQADVLGALGLVQKYEGVGLALMMARYTKADVIVVGLIGERGREVKEFVEDILGAQDRSRAVVVAAPADAPPLLRMQGAAYATAVAEHFRDKGKHVLLLMDSLTRYAQAQREIALAIGEPPATRGYPPSVFAKLPKVDIPTPAGNYNPDFGYALLQGDQAQAMYLVVETKGYDQYGDIPDRERMKIDAAKHFFQALQQEGVNVRFATKLNRDGLLQIMHQIGL